MPLKDLALNSIYSSEQDSLLHDFYIPALAESVRYDRAVGYFSAATLSYAAQGLSSFVQHEGKIRLLIGDPLEVEEYQAVKRGAELKSIHRRLNTQIQIVLESVDHELFKNRLELLSWLVAANQLEIRIALTVRGLYHDKVGVFTDKSGDQIVFQGSANETTAALLPDFNYETIAAYPSWKSEVFREYGQPQIDRFERLWNGEAPNLRTIALPSESYEALRKYHGKDSRPHPLEVREPPQSVEQIVNRDNNPKLPVEIGGGQYRLFSHQQGAVSGWKARDFRGILALATGAGKTITALHAAVKLAEAHQQRGRNFVLIVAVPYQILGDQWCVVMRQFNMQPIRCYRSREQWRASLDDAVSELKLSAHPQFLCAVVVNKTLARDDFQKLIRRVGANDMMFIGDECHHHASAALREKLPEARYRLGLSATPWTAEEEVRKGILHEYYGGIAATYSLGRALKDGVLTPYEYRCYPVRLSESETEEYQSLSDEIGRLFAIKQQGGRVDDEEIMFLRRRRSRILGSADAKFLKLLELIGKIGIQPHTLFYCGDGSTESDEAERPLRDVERCAKIVGQAGWKTSRFTAEESYSERDRIMENFRFGAIDGVVAIRVLDEGFDMPACRQAFLIASSRNDRQFIQRRGRILRKSPGKEHATIHDFLVLPGVNARSASLRTLVEQELMRCIEFTRFAKNSDSAWDTIDDVSGDYGFDTHVLTLDVEAREVAPE